MKKIIGLISLILIFSCLTGCLSDEQKKLVKQYEEEATKVMKDYLAENYSGAKILDAEQVVTFNTGFGYTIHDITKFSIKYKTKYYVFYYDKNKKIVYSNVNYNKITEEIKNYIIQNDSFNTESLSSFSVKIVGVNGMDFSYEVIRDSDKTLEDFLNTNNMDKYEYETEVEFIYNNINNFVVKDFFAENSFREFKNLKIIIKNYTNDLCSDYMQTYNSLLEENKAFVDYVHKKSILYEDVEVIYDDRYINLQIAKTDNYEQDPERNFYKGKSFVPINLAYAWNAEIIKPFESSKGNYTTEKGLNVEYSESQNSKLYIVLPEEKFQDTYYKSLRENMFDKVDYYPENNGKFNLNWNLNSNSKKNEDIISFYKEKVE